MKNTLDTITDLERWTVERSQLTCLLPKITQIPIKLCRTLEEFIEPQAVSLAVSDTIKSMFIQRKMTMMQRQLEEEDILRGIFLPKLGCFINGYALANLFDLKEVEQLFQHPQGCLELLTTLVHEKYGHGFISEYTTAGQVMAENHLYRIGLAKTFLDSVADSPENTLLQEKSNVVFSSSQLLEEGWSVWLENYVCEQIKPYFNEIISDRKTAKVDTDDNELSLYSLSQVREIGTTIARYGSNESLRKLGESLVTSIDYLATLAFPDSQPDPQQALQIALILQTLAKDGAFTSEFTYECGASFVHCAGLLLMRIAAQKFGKRCLSAITRLAGNVDLQIENSSLSELKDFTCNTPNGNIDARLIQLLSLPSVELKYNDPTTVLSLAWDMLSFPNNDS